MEAVARVATHQLDGAQRVSRAEDVGVVDAGATDEVVRAGAAEQRVGGDAERGGAGEIDESLALRTRERAAYPSVRRDEQHDQRDHDSRSGKRGELEPEGKTSGRGQGTEGCEGETSCAWRTRETPRSYACRTRAAKPSHPLVLPLVPTSFRALND